MTKWTYGPEGEAIPVQTGDVWRVGNHLFACSDLMESTLLDDILVARSASLLGQKPSLLYCDPPWGQALLNGFRTKAGRDKAEYNWRDLYKRIAGIGHSRDIPVFIEGSVIDNRDGKHIPEAIAYPMGSSYYWEVKYYRKHPSGLFYAGRKPVLLSLSGHGNPLTSVDDDFTPGIVMSRYSDAFPTMPTLVVDPCAGRGVTSRQAQENGWVSINNELSPNRVSASLVRMSKLIDQKPEKMPW